MTSEGSEPRPPDAPMPPPPPPNLAPPPGYTAYSQNLSAAVDLKRIGGLAKAILVLLVVFAVGTIIQIAGIPGVVDASKDFADGTIDDDQFRDDVGRFQVLGSLGGLAQLALVVLSVIWLYRIVKNHVAIGRRVTWKPWAAIAGWVLPPLLYIIPLLLLREHWKAADPKVAPGDDSWKRTGDNPTIWVWFVVYSIVPIVLSVAGANQQLRSFGAELDDLADMYVDSQGLLIAQSVVGIASAVAWGVLVRQFTQRHTELTGEARG
jgi:hypothetical protein